MENILELAEQARRRAEKVIGETQVESIWRSVGAEPHRVGSLAMGLLMRHRDIDLHIYSEPFRIADSFAAMAKLAECPGIGHIEYTNLLSTEEACIEWHASYKAQDGEIWQIDMIHIVKGSRYDGYFEEMARRIRAALTPETRLAILALKQATPDTEHIAGIEYYEAVLRDGVRSYADFLEWRKIHPVTGIWDWVA